MSIDWAAMRLLKSGLRRSGGVTKAVYDAGYNSSSRVDLIA